MVRRGCGVVVMVQKKMHKGGVASNLLHTDGNIGINAGVGRQ